MSAEVLEVESSDERFTAWMRGNLDRAAEHFRVRVAGEPVFGWRLRTISAPATGPAGDRWLRVESARPEWAGGQNWRGNSDAAELPARIPRPTVLGVTEWDSDGRRQRAELSTREPGLAPSSTDVLRAEIDISDGWWRDLRAALDQLRQVDTERVHVDQAGVSAQAEAAFSADLVVQRWETVHGDLHWTNLLAPRLVILDWESWGRGPVGTDAASLLCHSLLVPAVADRVRDTFADLLDTPDGRTAQRAVVAWMLARISHGDYPDMEQPLRDHSARLTAH